MTQAGETESYGQAPVGWSPLETTKGGNRGRQSSGRTGGAPAAGLTGTETEPRAGGVNRVAVTSPWALLKTDPKGVAKQTFAEFRRDRGPLAGAGLAFYWFLAIFPALIAAVGILDLLSLGVARGEIRRLINLALPPSAAQELTGVLGGAGDEATASIAAVAVGLAVALWGASTGMTALQEGFDVAYDISTVRSFARKRIGAFKLLGAAGLIGGLGIFVLAFGRPVGEAIQRNLLADWSGFMILWNTLRFGVAAVALVALVAVLYRFAPNRNPPPFRWLAPGGLVAVLIMAAVSAGFSFYVVTFGSYATTYGPLAGVIVLVLWLYLTAMALLLGAELNSLLERKSYGEA